jgi:hypothetical protein
MHGGGHAVFGEKFKISDEQYEKMQTLKEKLDEKCWPPKKSRKADEPL